MWHIAMIIFLYFGMAFGDIISGSSGSNRNSNASCFDDPSQMSCMNYIYPASNISNAINMLCMPMLHGNMGMPSMAGCSVSRQCKAKKASGQYCNGMSILADVCFVEQMSGMSACKPYAALCRPSSMVMQCTMNPSVPNFVSGMSAKKSVLDMCQMMPMDPCSDCTTSKCPDPLMTLGMLCQSMSGMKQCADWTKMCSSIGNGMGMYCGGSDGPIVPMMRMYFHTGINDIFLFKSWVPKNHFDYFLFLVFFFFLAVFQIFLKGLRSLKEKKWQKSDKAMAKLNSVAKNEPLLSNDGSITKIKGARIPFLNNSMRALFVFVTGTFDYCLMFAAMTFNVGIFFAVVCGFAFGTLLFGHKVKDGETYAMCCT